MYQSTIQFTISKRAVLIGFFLLVWLTGCERNVATAPESGVIVASSGKLPSSPKRIVSLAPNITEILFSVGLGDRVVAVTRFCDFPSEVKSLPQIGGLIDPDVENIATYKPDLVIGVTSGGNPGITRALDALKIPYAFVQMETLEETFEGIKTVARLGGAAEQGQLLHDDMRARLAKITARKSPHAHKVLVVFGHKPIVGAGPGTFAHDLVVLAGGVNVLADFPQAYPTLDIETVIKLNPDRILDIAMGDEADPKFWSTFQTIEAVHSGNVHPLRDASLMRPGPRLVEGLQHIGLAIHGKHTAH